MMQPTIRHITPGLGIVPTSLDSEACSGLVGAALGIAQAQSTRGYTMQLMGWNPAQIPGSWRIGEVEVHVTRGWSRARAAQFDFRVIAPLLNLSRRLGAVDVAHVYADPHLLLTPRANVRVLHLQTPVGEHPPRTWTHLLRRADAVVCCSEFIRRQFLERVEYPAERVFTVHNGIDESRYQGDAGARTRRAWGIDDDTSVVLFAGAVVPQKGLLHLLRAASRLPSTLNYEIVVAGAPNLWRTPESVAARGEDTYTRAVREAAEGLPVRWLGLSPSAAMPGIYAAADIFVAPSVWDEPFGMVACEAMAAGKPVIASRAGGLPEIVVDGQTGLLVSRGDDAALAHALERLLQDPELATRFGQQGRERASIFSWSSAASKLDDIYAGARESGKSIVTMNEPV